MDWRPHRSHARGVLLAAALVLVFVLTLEVSPAAGASRTACRITNTDSGQTTTRLQQAVDGAKPGARLQLTGTCLGKTTITKDLTIRGRRTGQSGRPAIEGGTYRDRILRIERGVTVTLTSLIIRSGGHRRPRQGAGIHNRGTLTLSDVTVRDYNAPIYGGGVLNKGELRLVGHTLITDNHAGVEGGGVYNAGRATLALHDSSRITGNRAWFAGGGVLNDRRGRVILNDASRISGNVARGSTTTFGGGVWNFGLLVLNDASRISGNRVVNTTRPDAYGGGVDNSGDVILNDTSSIIGNTSTGVGGGLRNSGRATLTGSTSIMDNTAGGDGGAVHNSYHGSVSMTGSSSITGNASGSRGGGVTNLTTGTLIGVVCGPDGNVYDNQPDDCYIEP